MFGFLKKLFGRNKKDPQVTEVKVEEKVHTDRTPEIMTAEEKSETQDVQPSSESLAQENSEQENTDSEKPESEDKSDEAESEIQKQNKDAEDKPEDKPVEDEDDKPEGEPVEDEAEADESETEETEGKKNPGKFVIKRTNNNGYMFNLKSSNGSIVATSGTYKLLNSCKVGINSVITNAPIANVEDQTIDACDFKPKTDPKFEMYLDAKQKFRFRLKARNGEIIAVSQGYTTKQNCIKGIDSVKNNAPISSIVTEEAV